MALSGLELKFSLFEFGLELIYFFEMIVEFEVCFVDVLLFCDEQIN